MNRIFVYDNNDEIQWESELYEPILHPSENKSGVVPPFNAYSAPGNITSVSLKLCYLYLRISFFLYVCLYLDIVFYIQHLVQLVSRYSLSWCM